VCFLDDEKVPEKPSLDRMRKNIEEEEDVPNLDDVEPMRIRKEKDNNEREEEKDEDSPNADLENVQVRDIAIGP
jgi:hypothetical protein